MHKEGCPKEGRDTIWPTLKMHFWFLLVLLVVVVLCSWHGPGSSLERSAWRAFDSSIHILSKCDGDEDAPLVERAGPSTRVQPATLGNAAGRTAAIRRRVTPLMAKRVAARYGFRCGICGKPLNESWETDHIVPLSQAKTATDIERLNAIENLQPVHRIPCHQMKSSRETSKRWCAQRARDASPGQVDA